MWEVRRAFALVLAFVAVVIFADTAHADVPVGPANLVPCPGGTGVSARYPGIQIRYSCHSAVADPHGTVVVLRQGQSDHAVPGERGFGWLHAWLDHNVADHVIKRVVSSSYARIAPSGRRRYSAELRVQGRGIIAVWVETDPMTSNRAPDNEPLGVLTAYCKLPGKPDPENKCPDWVNDSLLP